MNNIRLVLKDVKNNISFIVSFYIQLLIAVFFILISISQLTYDSDLNEYLSSIKDKGIITFKSYYSESNIVKDFNQDTYEILKNILDENRYAYSYILRCKVEEYPDKNICIFLGNFDDVFNFREKNNDNDIKAYLGSNIKDIDINDNFEFGYKKFKNIGVSNNLNKNSFFYHRNFKIDLDDEIVVVMSYEELYYLFGEIINQEIIQNLNFVKYDKNIMDNYLDIINNSETIYVVPNNSYDLYMDNYAFSFYNDLFFFLFFMIFLVFTVCGILVNLITNIDKNFREYSIHMIYGATKRKIFSRITLYTVLIIFPVVIFITPFIYISEIFYKYSFIELCIVSTIASIIFLIIVLLYPISKISRKNLLNYYRRDI